jgi:adenosylcobinamide-GDP ribazoletransferase
MREFAAAVSFLTRLPIARGQAFDARQVARSARWFPVVGAMLGAIYAAVLWLCSLVFPALVTGVVLACVDAALTGAMHLDGLADTADGFGGGRTREDVLRIMRDHSIGAYGTVALVLELLFKVASVAALVDFHGPRGAMAAVVLAPVLGRWSAVLSGATCAYARPVDHAGNSPDGSPARWMGSTELIIASVCVAAVIAIVMASTSDILLGPAAWALVAIAGVLWAQTCRRRLGGVTGDTLGAGVELSECLVFLLYLAVR